MNLPNPNLSRFRKKQGIQNHRKLDEAQGKEIWKQIAAKSRWKKLVARYTTEGLNPDTRAKSHAKLRAGVNSRWREEFQNKKSEDTSASKSSDGQKEIAR